MRVPALALALACAEWPLAAHCAPVATYTPDGSALNTTDWVSWLTTQAAAGVSTLILAPGSYTVEQVPSTRAHIVFPPLENVTLTCDGVTLTMLKRTSGALYVSQWTGVTITGLSVRYAQPPSNSARIVAINTGSTPSLDMIVEEGMPEDDFVAGTASSCNVFDASSRLMKPFTWDLHVSPLTPLPGQARGYRGVLANSGMLLNISVGDYIGCRVVGGQMTVTLDGTEGCTWRDVTLFGGPCFGFLESGLNVPGMRGGNTYERIAIRFPDAPPGALFPPLLSTSADGFHSSGVPRGPTIHDSSFEGMNDDGIAIHGAFTLITDADAVAGTVTIALHGGLREYTVGNAVLLYDPTFAPYPPPLAPSYFDATASLYTITAAVPAAEGYRPPHNVSHTMPSQSLVPGDVSYAVLTLVGKTPLPTGLTFDWILSDTSSCGNGFSLRNNTIQNHRARGMLIKASSGEIVGNRITNSSLGGIIITPELYWEEASYAHNLVVTHNDIDLRSSGRQSYGGIALGAVDPSRALASAQGHSGIVIEDNTVRFSGYAPIWLSSAGNVSLARNTLFHPFPAAPNNTYLPTCCEPVLQHVGVYAQHVHDLRASDNCVVLAPAGESALERLFVTDDVTGAFAGGVRVC